MDKETRLQKYDALVQATITNIFSLSKNSDSIILSGLDVHNDDDLFFLRVADLTQSISGKTLKIYCSFFEWIEMKIFFRLHKINIKMERVKNADDFIVPEPVLDYMLSLVNKLELPENFKWADIYHEYYK